MEQNQKSQGVRIRDHSIMHKQDSQSSMTSDLGSKKHHSVFLQENSAGSRAAGTNSRVSYKARASIRTSAYDPSMLTQKFNALKFALSESSTRLANDSNDGLSGKLGECTVNRIYKHQLELAKRMQEMHEKQMKQIVEAEERITLTVIREVNNISSCGTGYGASPDLRALACSTSKVGPHLSPASPFPIRTLPHRLRDLEGIAQDNVQDEDPEAPRKLRFAEETDSRRISFAASSVGGDEDPNNSGSFHKAKKDRRTVAAIEQEQYAEKSMCLRMADTKELDNVALSATFKQSTASDQISLPSRNPFARIVALFQRIYWEDVKAANNFLAANALPQEQNVCMRIIENKFFEGCISSLIVLNSITIGMQTNWNAQQALKEVPDEEQPLFRFLEIFFMFAFASEALLRASGQGLRYVFGRDWKWNLFDAFVVLAAIVEELISHLEANTNLTNIRVLRILRLVRIIRVIRITRFFRELRIMVCGIQASMQSLVWAMVLLLLVMFMFGVLIMQSITEAFANLGDSDDDLKLKRLYGTMGDTIYTLFIGVTSGANWADLADPLIQVVSPVFGLIWCLYIAIVVWALMNVITGVFVDGAIKMAEMDTESMVKEELQARKQHVKTMKRMFEEADTDGDGLVSWEEFNDHLGHPTVRAYFRRLGLDIAEARSFFDLLDFDGSGEINREEFVMGFTQLRGTAKSLDIARLRHEQVKETSQLQAQVMHLTEVVDEWFSVMAHQLGLDIDGLQAD